MSKAKAPPPPAVVRYEYHLALLTSVGMNEELQTLVADGWHPVSLALTTANQVVVLLVRPAGATA